MVSSSLICSLCICIFQLTLLSSVRVILQNQGIHSISLFSDSSKTFDTFCFEQMAGQLSDVNCIFKYEILLLLKILEYFLHLYAG